MLPLLHLLHDLPRILGHNRNGHRQQQDDSIHTPKPPLTILALLAPPDQVPPATPPPKLPVSTPAPSGMDKHTPGSFRLNLAAPLPRCSTVAARPSPSPAPIRS